MKEGIIPPVPRGLVFGVDTGGTFTDIVGISHEGRIAVLKVDNQAADATPSIADGLMDLARREGLAAGDIAKVVHCTTILGNSVIQRKGPVCGLITTAGFRDVLELGRQHNPVLYDIFWKKTPPLVPRRRCVEVAERVASDGSVVEPLDGASLEAALDRLEAQGVQSIAVCLINACTNPLHERAIARRIRERLPAVAVSLSSEVSPEWGEYERTSTTVTDAFVKPTFARYVKSLQDEMARRDLNPELFIMQSAGSIAPAHEAVEMPVHCLDSGPAAAVIAASNLGVMLGFPNVLTLEIGGTTAKSTLIEDGEARRGRESEIHAPIGADGRALKGGGYVLRMPVIDAAEVGAGGGSIARVDASGSLSVGPEGAGADPGPASYGRGGLLPTLTDANLVLGFLSERHLLGGTLKLDPQLAIRAIETHVAGKLGVSLLEAAFAIRSLANAIIARAVRTVSIERGRDVRRFALLAAGGGGPGHAADIARFLNIETVVIPPYAGLFASLGMLWSPPERRFTRALTTRLERPSAQPELAEALAGLARRAEESASLGEVLRLREEVDVHYVGQFHELTVPLCRDQGRIDPAAIREAFEAEHERSFGYRSPEERCEVKSVRLIVGYRSAAARDGGLMRLDPPAGKRPLETAREAYFGPQIGKQQARVATRAEIPEQPVQGPIIIPEYDTTVIVPPDFTAKRDATGSLILQRLEGA